jgi:hypothetical protein
MDTLSFLHLSVWVVAKWFVVVGFLVYILFALVVVKQTSLMLGTLEIAFEKPIKMLAWVHFLFSIGIFILALVIL